MRLKFKYGVICENSTFAIEWTVCDNPQKAYDLYLNRNLTARLRPDTWAVYKCMKVVYQRRFFKWAAVKMHPEKVIEAK
jgi:hypothetical protein